MPQPALIDSPRHRYACRPALRLRRKEGEVIFLLSFIFIHFQIPSFGEDFDEA
jgi:hypothetical protein